MKNSKFKTASFIIFLVAMVIITVICVPIVMSIKDKSVLENFVSSYGKASVFVMLGLQVMQIVVALIPGEIVEFVSGTMYGWFGGTVLCLVGIVIGEFIIFKIVRTLGAQFVQRVAGNEKIQKLKFMQNEKRLKTLTFILYFIPGTPKDLITYFMPLTKINMRDFLVISTFARVFSVVSSTYAGDTFADHDYIKLAIVYGVIILVSIAGIIANKEIEARFNRK